MVILANDRRSSALFPITALAAILLIAVGGLLAWTRAGGPIAPQAPRIPAGVAGSEPDGPTVAHLRVQVIAAFPHSRDAFTEGLVWQDGALLESTGLYGRSSLRRVDPESGQILQSVPVDPRFFGEGIALADSRLIQLTWRENTAFVYDASTFQRVGQLRYGGEGWGLCTDGARLVMSNGSSALTFRDPQTFDVLGAVDVTLDGAPVDQLNELECVGDEVYANVWMTDEIVRIDKQSGRVDATIDASGLLTDDERVGADVLNGIAYDPDDETFLITGKLWPKLFKVTFVSADSGG